MQDDLGVKQVTPGKAWKGTHNVFCFSSIVSDGISLIICDNPNDWRAANQSDSTAEQDEGKGAES